MSIQKVPKNVSKIMGTCLILKPIMVAPTFELKESIYNTFYQGLYKLKVEKNFSKGKLINGANKAIISSAQCIKDQKWDDFSNIAKSNVIKDLVEAMNKKSDEDKESLEKLLNACSKFN
ncbi:Hypothetical protein SRAE_2000112400 [Strongyloides ratti]|uniref:Uncharacterized protein n=1 Tax=Strongyloides ratti TaxID=34506 RepID=A0A090L9J0_STRRB|nr:Hypothetical protein SRAE_2000112400 [Strongyloides ratti]CEF66456.1 Hypothetical protein SRAE_2000112400 [Strongyloides ratti]